jgi:signal transduction histidine kinase
LVELLAGVALFGAAALLATDPGRRAPAIAAFALGIAWTSDSWAGWTDAPDVVQNVGMLLVPTVPPAALLVVAILLPWHRARVAGAAVAAAAFGAALALWLVRDPFLDRYCWRDCIASAFAPFASVDRLRTLTNVTLALGIACGLVTVLLCALGLGMRAPMRRAIVWALAPGLLLGTTLATSGLVLLIEPEEDPERLLFMALFVARGAVLTAFAAGLAAVALRPSLMRAAIARLAGDRATASSGDFASALARALGEPELRIGYPLPGDDAIVGVEGTPVAMDDSAVRLVRGDELVALVGSPGRSLSAATLDRELGPAGRLALANERLRAEQLARLHELTELRRRIVATGDSERQRLERDLHDGAQQRLLALTLDLRVAHARAEAEEAPDVASSLREAVEHVTAASTELRAIAHSIFPAVLMTSGLGAALETLADDRPLALSVDVDTSRRLPGEVEAAAYAIVAEGTADTRGQVTVDVRERNGQLVVSVVPWTGSVVSVEDRVGALDGTVEWSGRRLEALLPVPPPA